MTVRGRLIKLSFLFPMIGDDEILLQITPDTLSISNKCLCQNWRPCDSRLTAGIFVENVEIFFFVWLCAHSRKFTAVSRSAVLHLRLVRTIARLFRRWLVSFFRPSAGITLAYRKITTFLRRDLWLVLRISYKLANDYIEIILSFTYTMSYFANAVDCLRFFFFGFNFRNKLSWFNIISFLISNNV